MLSCLISLFLSCYCSGCHSLLYVSQVSWPSSCLIPLTSCQLWCPGCMLAGFTWDTSKGTHWLDLRVIPVMTSPSPVYSQLPWGTFNIFFFSFLHQQTLTTDLTFDIIRCFCFPCRPVTDPMDNLFDRMLCARSRPSEVALPISDPTKASRRRYKSSLLVRI